MWRLLAKVYSKRRFNDLGTIFLQNPNSHDSFFEIRASGVNNMNRKLISVFDWEMFGLECPIKRTQNIKQPYFRRLLIPAASYAWLKRHKSDICCWPAFVGFLLKNSQPEITFKNIGDATMTSSDYIVPVKSFILTFRGIVTPPAEDQTDHFIENILLKDIFPQKIIKVIGSPITVAIPNNSFNSSPPDVMRMKANATITNKKTRSLLSLERQKFASIFFIENPDDNFAHSRLFFDKVDDNTPYQVPDILGEMPLELRFSKVPGQNHFFHITLNYESTSNDSRPRVFSRTTIRLYAPSGNGVSRIQFQEVVLKGWTSAQTGRESIPEFIAVPLFVEVSLKNTISGTEEKATYTYTGGEPILQDQSDFKLGKVLGITYNRQEILRIVQAPTRLDVTQSVKATAVLSPSDAGICLRTTFQITD
ncbi:hypothetical protein RF11_14961 [Thelohanellus kitauei]|uniref:Uncharacterized protein n=1 Tax=Thelohanellus kitauei TaxID=669202 RepID=A0A0C2MTZ7_THEKT|nr:hypothetical protein RF11_14961 [Thelohanellus kitauei]